VVREQLRSMVMTMENIFGVQEDTAVEDTTGESTEDFVLNLTDEDLDNTSSQYVPIPAGTTTNFLIYEMETSRSQAGNPQWRRTPRAVGCRCGPCKRSLPTDTFSP